MSDDDIKIRRISPSDVRAVVGIEKKCFKDPYPDRLLTALATFFSKSFLVTTVEDIIVGYACAVLESPPVAHLLSIAVDPSRRHQGLGKRLMKKLMAVMKREGAATIKLEVRKGNNEAIDLYRSLGFKQTRTLRYYYGDGEEALVFTLSLRC